MSDEPSEEELAAATDAAAADFAAAMPPAGPFFAARVTDMHICPMVTGVVPHVGGPILPPAWPQVLIGNMPAARLGDMCTCVGPPDVIIRGEPTVLIGNMPAARMLDTTAHGGVIVTGFPTVIIGGSAGGGGPGGPSTPRPANPDYAPFDPDLLRSQIGQGIQGEGDPALAEAMNTLYENRDNPNSVEVDQALQTVAEIRGESFEQMQNDWNKYQGLLAEQRQVAGEETPAINTWLHGDFMGSRSQLRSGGKVGEMLGVDPVFGALLNPTGGLVGPGNMAFDMNDSAAGHHGAVHDAAGYAINNHNRGPGYDYLGTDNRDTTSPLSGQRNGIGFYRDSMPDRSRSQTASDAAGHGLMYGVVGAADAWNAI